MLQAVFLNQALTSCNSVFAEKSIGFSHAVTFLSEKNNNHHATLDDHEVFYCSCLYFLVNNLMLNFISTVFV